MTGLSTFALVGGCSCSGWCVLIDQAFVESCLVNAGIDDPIIFHEQGLSNY